jgi:ATP-dependent RNA helicase DDX49/DBP8
MHFVQSKNFLSDCFSSNLSACINLASLIREMALEMPKSASYGALDDVSDAETTSSASDDPAATHELGSRKRKRAHRGSDATFVPNKPSSSSASLSRIKAKKDGLLSNPAGVADSEDSVLRGEEKKSFADIGVTPWLVSSLSEMAIIKPTGIQKGCIPEILKGRDCIGGSRTGSGKTVAFAVPILQKWAEDPFGIYAVVLTPTRCVRLWQHV